MQKQTSLLRDSEKNSSKNSLNSLLFWGRFSWYAFWVALALGILIPSLVFGVRQLIEVPRLETAMQRGLEQNFDGLAGIIYASKPDWTMLRKFSGGRRFFLLDSMLDRPEAFSVWLELDERPGWYAGAGGIKYSSNFVLDWVARSNGVIRPGAE